MSLAQWNQAGLIPPIDLINPPSGDRSPYKMSLLDFIQYFTQIGLNLKLHERIQILKGFINYRAELHKIGINDGFQWLNGSFVTRKELISDEAPNDIDVVTFFYLKKNQTQQDVVNSNPFLFQRVFHNQLKQTYLVDAYHEPIEIDNKAVIKSLIDQTAYWYSLWSHQRDTLIWKGFIEIELTPNDDVKAVEFLDKLENDLNLL